MAATDNDDMESEETGLIRVFRLIKRLWPLWTLIIGLPMVLILHAGTVLHWTLGGILLACLMIGIATFRKGGRAALAAFFKAHWKKLMLAAVFVPIVAPPTISYYTKLLGRDWERTMNAPELYFIWNVNSGEFSKGDQKKLERWDPRDPDKNEDLRRLILMAANAVNIQADRLTPFDPSLLKRGVPFTLVVFESWSPEEQPPQAGTRLVMYFITPYEPPEGAKELKGNTKSDEQLAKMQKTLFKMVVKSVPRSLDLRLAFLVDGFSQSSGHPVSLDILQEIIDRNLDTGPG